MDLCFTKRELSWLDDLMPESKKKKEDDKKKKAKEVSVQKAKSELKVARGNCYRKPKQIPKYLEGNVIGMKFKKKEKVVYIK